MNLQLTAGHRSAPRLRGSARAGPDRRCARATSRSSRSGWSEHALPTTYEEARERLARTAALLAGVAQARHVPRSPVALAPAAQRADAQGPHLRAVGSDDRRRRRPRCRRLPAATATGTTATAGSATRRSCCGRCTRSASTRRPTTSSTSSPTWPRPRRDSSRSCTGSGARASSRSRSSTHLSGYEHARPVRIGNGAYNQAQHDVWGAVLDSIYLHTRSRDQLPDRLWPIIKRQVEARSGALARSRPRDLGGARRPQALHLLEADVLGRRRSRRAAGAHPQRRARWRRAGRRPRPEIHADICANGVDERGVFVQHYETDALDASLLLMPLVRFLPPDDPRIRATVLAIADELTENGLVLRYRVGRDRRRLLGRGGHVHDLLVLARLGAGRDRRARPGLAALCEKLLSYASPLALYAEEIDAGHRPSPRATSRRPSPIWR